MAGGCLFLIIIFLVSLVPAWLLMLSYNFIVEIMGFSHTIPITFLSVVCVSIILMIIRSIFKK